MKPGPRPRPARVHLLAGGKTTTESPKPKPTAPRCPAWLPPDGKKFWRQMAPKLEKLGLLTELDGQAQAGAATSWANAVEAARRIKTEGMTRKDENGVERKHPCFQVLRESLAGYRQFMAEFGLSPASRQQLNVQMPVDDEFARYFEYRNQPRGGGRSG